jgi:exopolysaccharide biosynthesis protein
LAFPIEYKRISDEIDGARQEIFLLEADISRKGMSIRPVLSFDRIFGYEVLSEMAEGHDAFALVNAGFFYEYGDPSGMIVADGELITASTGAYPVFGIKDGRAFLKELDTQIIIETEHGQIEADGINRKGKEGELIIYMSVYGSSNRAKSVNKTYIVADGIITGANICAWSTDIPSGGMLITYYGSHEGDGAEAIPLNVGDSVEVTYSTQEGTLEQAYECGCWLVRDRKEVTGKSDPWIGVLTNHDPRTVVGLKDKKTVVFMVADGRQPGYSRGFTAAELAEYLLSLGVRDAAMLDGGASSEMIVQGEIVNRPSFKGEERPLGGGFALSYTSFYHSEPSEESRTYKDLP